MAFRNVQAQVLSHAQLVAGTCNWRQVLGIIVEEVCKEIPPAWMSEVSLMHSKNKSYGMFFKAREHVAKFMKIRKVYITALLSDLAWEKRLVIHRSSQTQCSRS